MSTAAPELVHSRLDHWAHDRGAALAIQSEAGNITFEALAQQVQAHAQALHAARAPATVLLDAHQTLLQRLVAFWAPSPVAAARRSVTRRGPLRC